MSEQIFYVRGADSKMYAEIPLGNGEYEYEPAEKGLAYLELPNNKFLPIRDTQVAQEQAKGTSHEQYFERLKAENPKQAMKRQAALQRQFEQMAIDTVTPPRIPGIEFVTDEKFMDLMAEYKKAVLAGNQKDSDFQPVLAYPKKLFDIRPLYKGEVGIRGSTILCLEEGYGAGNTVSVLGGKDDE